MTQSDGAPRGTIGGNVAGKVAAHLTDAVLNAKARSAGVQTSIAQRVLADFTNHVSDEVRSVMGPLFRAAAEDPGTPESVRPLLHALGTQRGQAWAWIGGTATGAALGAGLLDMLNNALAPLTTRAIAHEPNMPVTVQDAVRAEALGVNFANGNAREAAFNGIEGARFQVLAELARAIPTPGDIAELVNRGTVNLADALALLKRQGYSTEDSQRLLSLRQTELSAETVAAAWARSELTAEQTDELGARVGSDPSQMKVYRALAGMPPSPEELLFALRRGIITESDVDRGIIQGPIRNEWIPVIKALQWIPMPAEEAAISVNQGHMSYEDGERKAREYGVPPEDFKVIVENAGIPPGPQEALDWVNRGLITEDQFREMFLESRIKNKYIDLYLQSRHETMPPETIRLMYTRGALTVEDALRRLQARGYSAEDAAIILDGASAEKTQASRDLTVSNVRQLYAQRVISAEDATLMLTSMGYDDQEASWELILADLGRTQRLVNAAVSKVKSAYVGRRIDEIDAGTFLDQLGLPAEFKDDSLYLWDIERTTATKVLTTAQVVAAIKKSALTVEEGMARIVGQGYAEEDAVILLQTAGVIPVSPQ